MHPAAEAELKAHRPDPTRTGVDLALEVAQKLHAGDPERADLIARARRFKSSWIELAQALTACRQHERYKRWGFRDFEGYHKRELKLKGATVDKLIASFSFLDRAAPEFLRRDGLKEPIPGYQALDFLRRAEEAQLSGNADEATVAEVRRAVLDDNLSLPKITRLFKESLFPSGRDEARDLGRGATKSIARLQEQVSGLHRLGALPPGVARSVEEALNLLLQSLPLSQAAEEEDVAEAPARAARAGRQASAQA